MSGRRLGRVLLIAGWMLFAAVESVMAADGGEFSPDGDREAFGTAYVAIANRMYPSLHFRFVAKDFSVTVEEPDHSARTVYLDNAYLTVRGHPADEQAIIAHYVSAIVGALASEDQKLTEEDRFAVLPVIKGEQWVSGANQLLQKKTKPDQVFMRQLAGGLYEIYVIDTPQAMRFVNASALAELKLSPEQIHDQATRNLALLLPAMQVEKEGDLSVIHLDTNYETSLALIFERWKSRLDLRGDPVFALPARGELLVADSKDGAAVQHLRARAREDWRSSSYPVTARLYIVHGDSWKVLE